MHLKHSQGPVMNFWTTVCVAWKRLACEAAEVQVAFYRGCDLFLQYLVWGLILFLGIDLFEVLIRWPVKYSNVMIIEPALYLW